MFINGENASLHNPHGTIGFCSPLAGDSETAQTATILKSARANDGSAASAEPNAARSAHKAPDGSDASTLRPRKRRGRSCRLRVISTERTACFVLRCQNFSSSLGFDLLVYFLCILAKLYITLAKYNV